MTLEQIFSLLANMATFGGIVVALIVFFVERRRYIREKELATYCTTCTDYIEYLKLCLDHPEISTVETAAVHEGHDALQRKRELIGQLIVNMLERAYFMYRHHDSKFKKKQWQGWNEYIEDWCRHPLFREQWPTLLEQYDEDFIDHVTGIYKRVNDSSATASDRPGSRKDEDRI